MVGQENQQVFFPADAKRDAESNGIRRSQSSTFYSIMEDDTTNSSNLEQVVLYFRWVDNSLDAHDKFIRLQQVDRIDAAIITVHN